MTPPTRLREGEPEAPAEEAHAPTAYEWLAAAALSLVVWASCSTASLVDVGPLTLRPLDLAQLVLLAALLPILLRRRPGALRASRPLVVAGVALLVAILASAGWVALDEPEARSAALPSAVRVAQLGLVAVAAGWLSRTLDGKQRLLDALAVGAAAVSALYALAHIAITAPLELLELNPGKSAVGPVAVASVVLALMTVRWPLRYRLALGAAGAFNLLFAVSMTAYLTTIVVLPALVWVLLRLRRVSLLVHVAAVTAVAVLCSAYAFAGLRVLRPDALPTRVSAPLTLDERPAPAAPDAGATGSAGPVVEDGSEGLAGATILHRAILMSTAFELFERAPVTGVGWTRGDDIGVVDAPDVVAEIKRRFPSGYDTLFTDVSPLGAHNAGLQVLAELGLLGGLPLLALLVAVVLAALRVRPGRVGGQDAVVSAGWVGLVAVALGFLMFTGLYPGQVETLLAAVALGAASMLPTRATAKP